MDFKKMLPFLEEDELKELVAKLEASPDGTYQGITMKQVLPFLEDEDVDQMIASAYDKGLAVSSFLPFASDKGLTRLVERIIAKPGEPKVSLRSFLPFLEDEAIVKLADQVIACGGSYGDLTYALLLPYMEDETIDKSFLSMATSGDPMAKKLAPYASEDAFHDLVKLYIDGLLPDLDIDSFYPYMDDDDIRTLFHKAQKD